MSSELRYILELCGRALDWRYYDLLKIPGPPGTWLGGHLADVGRPDYHLKALEWVNEYGGICRFRLGYQHIVLVADPLVASEVLGRGPRAVPRKCIGYRFFELAINHLNKVTFFTTTDEDHWRALRKGTAAAFSFSKIRSYFPTAYKHAQQMATQLQEHSQKGQEVEVQQYLEVMLMDVFVEALFEIDPKLVDGEGVAHAMNLLLEEANTRIRFAPRGFFLPIFAPKYAAEIRTARAKVGALYELIHDSIRQRGPPKQNDASLWACLARLQNPKTGKLMSREQLVAEIGVYIVAGYDTSSHTIAWTLYALAVHPEEQALVHQELASKQLLNVKGSSTAPRSLQLEDLADLTRINCVLDETMRMYPVGATGSVRECSKVTRVGPYTVPAGTMVWPMIYALNMSNHNWPDPQTFRPDRWLEKGAACLPGTTAKRFLPFSDGTKNCLGQALGLMEVRTVLAVLLSHFRVELAPDMGGPQGVESKMMCALTLKINGGLRLRFTPHGPDDTYWKVLEPAQGQPVPAQHAGPRASRERTQHQHAPYGPEDASWKGPEPAQGHLVQAKQPATHA